MSDQRDKAFQLMQAQRLPEARELLEQLVVQQPDSWNDWYLLGQCCRFMNDIPAAIESLRRATELNPHDSGVFLALGIALQLSEDLPEALEVLHKAIHIDPDYDTAYNSIGVTLRKMCEFERADKAYDAGLNALARRIVKGMKNDRHSPLIPTPPGEFGLWAERAVFGATFISVSEPEIDFLMLPSGDAAVEEEQTHAHEGLFWCEVEDDEGRKALYFLPNYFNTFHATLRENPIYSNLLANRGVVLEELGREEEAREHYREADSFKS